jgi:hypothetical protein
MNVREAILKLMNLPGDIEVGALTVDLMKHGKRTTAPALPESHYWNGPAGPAITGEEANNG